MLNRPRKKSEKWKPLQMPQIQNIWVPHIKQVKDIYNKKFKSLKKESEEDIKNEKISHALGEVGSI